jgi:hypothetical protein
MRLEVAFAGAVNRLWTDGDDADEPSTYLSVLRGFIVSLHMARNTKNVSLTKRSFVDRGR